MQQKTSFCFCHVFAFKSALWQTTKERKAFKLLWRCYWSLFFYCSSILLSSDENHTSPNEKLFTSCGKYFYLKTSAFFLKSSHRLFFNGKHPFSTERCLASNLSFISKMTRLSVIIICSICSKLFVSVFSKTFVLCSVASLVFFAEEVAVLYGCPCVFGLFFCKRIYLFYFDLFFYMSQII